MQPSRLERAARALIRFWWWFQEHEEGRFFLWLPVFLGLGIGLYFALPVEPPLALVALFFVVALGLATALRYGAGLLMLSLLIGVLASGFALAKLRVEMVRAPVLQKARGFYEISGSLRQLVALPGGKKQLVLTRLHIRNLPAAQTPKLVRLVSRVKQEFVPVGARVRVKAVLRPPPGPARPDGFDFARKAYFSQLGGVGFAVSKLELIGSQQGWELRSAIEQLRQSVTRKIRASVSGAGGDIVLALIVGEKRSIDKQVLQDIRAAGLAHMLAISGMHMALVSGSVYWLLRALLALGERLTLSRDIRWLAAFGAMSAAGFYFALSGMGLATLRAFVMISIMFVAMLSGRTAISLRNVALAALLILVFMPESLLDVGFQMSFAAVTALIAFYEGRGGLLAKPRSQFKGMRFFDRLLAGIRAIFMTTLVAGLAVTPIAVFHFHHLTPYSVLGNVLAMPVLTLIVMPAALLALVLMPFGLHDWPLAVMSYGTDKIVEVAQMVAGLNEARVNVGTISPLSLLLMVAGGLWLCLWRSDARFAGLIVIAGGLAFSFFRDIPFLLVERDGKNVVLIDDRGHMWPVDPRKGRYSLAKWRSAYGAGRAGKSRRAKAISAKNGWRCDQFGCTGRHHKIRVSYSTHPGALAEDCARSDILVATYRVPVSFANCRRVRLVIDLRALKKNGSYAVFAGKDGFRVSHARQIRGQRPWTVHN